MSLDRFSYNTSNQDSHQRGKVQVIDDYDSYYDKLS